MFAEKLKQRREELCLTQEELGGFISDELSRQSVSKWERGETFPEVDKLLVLSVKLNISLDELFAEELAYLRRNDKSENDLANRYPGAIAGVEAFAKALRSLNY